MLAALARPPAPLPHGSCRAAPRLAGRQSFSTCEYSSSTGVARPKIDTATLRRPRSSSTSSTRPLNDVKGPSATRTCSPISNEIDGFGRAGLTHHQAGAGQHAADVAFDDGGVDPGIQAKVIGDEIHFPAHERSL